MADYKITQLAEVTALEPSDLLTVVTDVGSTPINKKITKANMAYSITGTVNVKDFGAAGDGTTDDTVAIQAAIDAAKADRRKVWFPSGIYLISASINLNYDGVSIEGENMYNDGVSIKAAPSFSGTMITVPAGTYWGRIFGLNLDGSNVATKGVLFGEKDGASITTWVIDNFKTRYIAGNGIEAYEFYQSRINNYHTFGNTGTGFYGDDCYANFIDMDDRGGNYAIYLDGGMGNIIRIVGQNYNTARNATVRLTGGASCNVITGYFENGTGYGATDGVVIIDGESHCNTIDACLFTDSRAVGTYHVTIGNVADSGASKRNKIVNSSFVEGSTGNHVHLVYAAETMIQNCTYINYGGGTYSSTIDIDIETSGGSVVTKCDGNLDVVGGLNVDGNSAFGRSASVQAGIINRLGSDSTTITSYDLLSTSAAASLYGSMIAPALRMEGVNHTIHYGLLIRPTSLDDGSSRTVDSQVGLYIDVGKKASNTTVTNAIGLYLKQPTIGGTLNYSIYNEGNQKNLGTLIQGSTGNAISNLNWNATASVADGGTITHGMGATPTAVIAIGSTAAAEIISVTAIGATTFVVNIKKNDGSAGTTQTIYWMALK